MPIATEMNGTSSITVWRMGASASGRGEDDALAEGRQARQPGASLPRLRAKSQPPTASR